MRGLKKSISAGYERARQFFSRAVGGSGDYLFIAPVESL